MLTTGKILMITSRRYHHFWALWGLSFWMIAFWCRNFIFKIFTKEWRSSLEVSEIFALLLICFSCLIIVGKAVNLLLTFVIYLHDYFPCYFLDILALDEVMVKVISFGVRRSFLIVFLFHLNLYEEVCWLKIFSDWDTFCAVCLC